MYGVTPRVFKELQRWATVYFPIWWYVAPTIINTFVENVDLDSKKVIPFATSGGSGMGKTLANLKPSCPGANWVEGKVINGMSEKALADWAEKL